MKLRSLKTWSLFLLCIPALLLIASCGGGGGSSTTSPQAAPTTLTGKFIDAPVEGLKYISGTVTGTTAADGTFMYVVADGISQDVTFKIGDLVVGTCQGKNIVTPVDLVRRISGHQDAAFNDPLVTGMVRFLLGIGDLSNPARIRIADSIHGNSLLTGTLSPLLGNAVAMESLINGVISSAVFPTEDAARNHFASSLYTLYGGTYQMTLSGVTDTGTFSDNFAISVGNDFAISGSYASQPLTGTLDPVSGLFNITVTAGVGCQGAVDGSTGAVLDGVCRDATGRYSLSGHRQ